MSIEITIIDSNDKEVTFNSGDTTTIRQICEEAAVLNLFGNHEDSMLSELDEIDDSGFPEAFRGTLADSVPAEGTRLTFLSEFQDAEEEVVEPVAPAGPVVGALGIVVVEISGGLQTAQVPIVNGVTTLKEVVYSDTVKARSGMDDVRLSNCTVMLNDLEVPACQQESRKVVTNDVISLNVRYAGTKG